MKYVTNESTRDYIVIWEDAEVGSSISILTSFASQGLTQYVL